LPTRFTIPRTGCGFVFISLLPDQSAYWENVLLNFTEIYKYKRRLEKCLGVIIFKTDEYFDINWAFTNSNWSYNKEMEDALRGESGYYSDGEIKDVERYKLKEYLFRQVIGTVIQANSVNLNIMKTSLLYLPQIKQNEI
jgi:hypothetical protein